MLSSQADAEASCGMDFDVYDVQAATDHAEEQEILQRIAAARRLEGTGYRREWSPERRYLAGIFDSLKFEFAMGALLVFNFVVVVLESDATARCVHETTDSNSCSTNPTFTVINTILLGVYCVEFGVKAIIWQRDLFRCAWNIFDGSIVLASLAETTIQLIGFSLPSMQFLRIFRVVRLFRTVRLMELFPELYFMVRGFASAVAAMWWGFVLIAVWIIAWSILSVELVNPANKDIRHETVYCQEAFSSVYKACLLFFQTLVAGDSWGTCILPILQDSPQFGFIFVGAIVSIQLGFTNLVLSVIVDAASKERNSEAKLEERVKKTQAIEAKEALVSMFLDMDRDKTGTITLEEFVRGYENDDSMCRQMEILRIGREDLDNVFALIDEDNSGSLELGEFCRFIAGVQESDSRVTMMTVKTQVSRVLQKVEAIQAAMENVAVVTGAESVPTRSRRKSKGFKYRLSKRVFSGWLPVSSTPSLTRRATTANMSTVASSGQRRGKQASATSTAQRDDAAAKCGGEHEEASSLSFADGKQASAASTTQRDAAAAESNGIEATAGAPLAFTPCVVPAVAFGIEASSLSCPAGQQASAAATTRGDEAAAKGGGENGEATADFVPAAGASCWEPMPDTDIRTPQPSRSSCGSSSNRFGISDPSPCVPRSLTYGVRKPTGDTLGVVECAGTTPSTPPGSTYREGKAPAPA